MTLRLCILGLLAGAWLTGCAADPSQPPTSYGPANNFSGMAPDTGLRSFHGMSGWGAGSDENFHPATPPPFKGF